LGQGRGDGSIEDIFKRQDDYWPATSSPGTEYPKGGDLAGRRETKLEAGAEWVAVSEFGMIAEILDMCRNQDMCRQAHLDSWAALSGREVFFVTREAPKNITVYNKKKR
jgi:hypothetical protein